LFAVIGAKAQIDGLNAQKRTDMNDSNGSISVLGFGAESGHWCPSRKADAPNVS